MISYKKNKKRRKITPNKIGVPTTMATQREIHRSTAQVHGSPRPPLVVGSPELLEGGFHAAHIVARGLDGPWGTLGSRGVTGGSPGDRPGSLRVADHGEWWIQGRNSSGSRRLIHMLMIVNSIELDNLLNGGLINGYLVVKNMVH